MDNYVSPWESLFNEQNFTETYKEKYLQFYLNFMATTFHKNIHLEKAMIAGTYPISEELREYAFKKAIECNSLTGTFMEYYGFNQWEMEYLYNYLNIPNDMQKQITNWYNGFTVNNKDIRIYNPWSVANFLCSKKFDTFWMDVGSVSSVIEACSQYETFKARFYPLLNGSSITIQLDYPHYLWEDFREFTKALLFNHMEKIDQAQCNDRMFMFLYFQGYLTLCDDVDIKSNSTSYRVKLPNNEVTSSMIWDWKFSVKKDFTDVAS